MAINLSSMLITHINKPCIKNSNIVLYTHVADFKGELTGNDVETSKSDKLIKVGKNNYSSPTNIRKVFITADKVLVQTYKPIIKGGKADTNGCWNESSLEKENIKEAFFNNEKERFTGNIFKIFYKPWVMSNIEEIYIDWTLLISDDIQNRFPEAAQLLQLITDNSGGRVIKSDLPQRIFEDANGGNFKSIRERYPRLKCIAMISNLGQIINNQHDKGKSTGSIEDFSMLWIRNETNKRLLEQSNSVIILNTLFDDIGRINRNFAVRDGVYKFDSEILKPYFKDIQSRMLEEARKRRDSKIEYKNTGKVFNTNVSDKVGQEINNIINKHGINTAKMIFNLALSTLTKSQAGGIIEGTSDDSIDNIFIEKMGELQKILGNEEIKRAILEKYEILTEITNTDDLIKFISKHAKSYKVLFALNIVNWLRMELSAGSEFVRRSAMEHLNLSKLITDKDMINVLCNKCGITRNDYSDIGSIIKALSEFNKKKDIIDIDIEIEGDFDDYIDDDEDSDFDIDGLEDYLDEDEEEYETPVKVTESTLVNNEPTDIEMDDFDNYLGEDEEDSKEPLNDEEVIAENKSDTMNKKDIASNGSLEEIKDIWKSKIDGAIQSILTTYSTLYESGYGLVSPSGILTQNGIIKSTTNGEIEFTGERPIDIEIFNAIQSITGDKFNNFASIEEKIDINKIMKSHNIMTYTGQHLKYMFGHIRFCTNESSLKRYMTKHKILLPSEAKSKSTSELSGCKINDSETKIIKYSTMKGWIKESLEDIFLNAYREVGIGVDITQDTINKANKVNNLLSRTLKNVIVVAERKKGVNTRLRISSDELIDVNKLIDTLTKRLNVGASRLVKITQIGNYENGVLDVNIIYNDKSYSQDALFAHQVLDILEEQGIVPSWNNVILGKKDDGTIMTYNFKDTKNPIYGMYAGTRSGKGVMTLNLLASALADGCKVIYIDGKPEIAVTLGDIAWKDGLDACVFNGLEVNQNKGLENRGNCIRQSDRFASAEHIPDNIFKTEDEMKMFMLTVQYLRGIELVIKMAKDRMDRCKPEDWMVAVFDECEQFASQEEYLNNILNKAYENRKKAIDPSDDKGTRKINITKDPAAIFIDDYKMWRERLESEFLTGVKSAFGKGNITLFFVWQSSKFPNTYKNNSSLAAMVESSRSKMIKIMGRGAVEQGGSNDFGNATTLKDMKWYDKRFNSNAGGFFAIGSDIKRGMQVFRPFNIYSDSNGKDLILTNAEAAGLKKEDLVGSQLDEDFNVIPEVGFEGYTNKLLGRMGLSAAQQLNIGFQYANQSVINLGLGTSLLDFMYNSHSFTGNTVKVEDSIEGLNFDNIKMEGQGLTTDNSKVARGLNTSNIMEEDVEDLDFGTLDDEQFTFDKQKTKKVSNKNNERFNNSILYEDFGIDLDSSMREQGKFKSTEEPTVRNVDSSYQEVRNKQPAGRVIGKSFNDKKPIYSINDIIKLNSSNSIKASMSHKVDKKYENFVFRTMAGSRYEFKRRWESIIESICNSIKANMVTRITITSDEIVVNNRLVIMDGIIGGDADVRIEDIVDFKTLLKRFRNVREFTVDAIIFQRAVELYNDPLLTFFEYSRSLKTINLIGNGSVRVDRSIYMDYRINQEQKKKMQEARYKSQLDVMSASRNKNFNKLSPGYKSRIWDATKRYQGNAWGAIGKGLLKDNPRYFRLGAIALSSLAVLTVGGTISAFQGIFKMFK